MLLDAAVAGEAAAIEDRTDIFVITHRSGRRLASGKQKTQARE